MKEKPPGGFLAPKNAKYAFYTNGINLRASELFEIIREFWFEIQKSLN